MYLIFCLLALHRLFALQFILKRLEPLLPLKHQIGQSNEHAYHNHTCEKGLNSKIAYWCSLVRSKKVPFKIE